MDEGEFEYDEYGPTARRMQSIDLAVLGLDLAAGIFEVLGNTLRAAQGIVAMHANHNMNRDIFYEEAAREIETLISGETDG
jgi:hypothetical protein